MRKILLLILSLVFSVHLFAQPSFTSASYDEKTSVLTLNFDKIVQNDNVILGGINIIPGGILNPIILDENSAVLPQDNSNSVNIVLYNNGNFSLKDKICDLYTNSIEGLKVKLNLATVIDVNNVENAESGLVNLTFNENSTPLKLTGAVFESEGNYLKLSFNDAITTESNNAGDIKIVNSSGDAISISQLKDNIMLNGDSSLWIQLNSTSLNAIHSAEFAGSDIQILKGAVKDQIWNSVADTLFNLTYIAPTFEVKAVSAIYREEKNRLEIDFNVDIQNEDWNESSVVSFRKIHLYTPADTVSILADPTFIQVIGETIRIKLQLGDQERIETTFNDTMDIKLLIEAGAVFSETTYVPCISSDTVEVEYEMQDETKRFILDPENTYYSGGGHFLNVAFLGTSSALYNTIDKITDADDDEFANFRSIRIQFVDKDTSISLPLGMLVPYDSVNTGLFRIPGDEARTLMLMNMDSATLKIKFDPFTFINKRDHGNAGAEFALNIMPAGDAPNYESVVYETDSAEVIITFDKPINDEQYITSGITFGGLAIGNIESTTLSVDQKTLRLKLETALTGLSKDPDVEIPAGAFTSIFGAPTSALNSSSENYDDVVKGIGRYFWIRDKHKFTRATYQKFCLLREDSNANVEVYVDIDEWNSTFNQNSLDAFLDMFNDNTPGAAADSLKHGISSGVQSLYGNVSFNDGGKVIAVLTDVHDNYDVGGNDSNINLFVPGFYEPRNSLSVSEYQFSNEKDMFFLDTSPQYWDFADTTGLNTAIEEGTNTSEQAMADIFTRIVIDKINPEESAWAQDGFAGLSQILLTGEYSQFFLNNLGIKFVPIGTTPLSGNYNFSTRDNQVASTTFILYLFENVYPANRMQFLTEYFSDNSISSFEKVTNLVDGYINEWFNAYSFAQAIEGDGTYSFTAGDEAITAKTGFEYVEYDAIPVLNLPRFFGSPRDNIGSKSIAAFTINMYTIPNDTVVAGGKDLSINASAADTSFSVFSLGQYLEQTGILNDELFAIKQLDFNEDNNAILYPEYSNGIFDTASVYNHHIISACAAQLNEMIISTDATPPAIAELYLLPNVLNDKFLTIGIVSDEDLYNDTRELPDVFVDSDDNTQQVEITQKESNIGVNIYVGNWQFVNDGNYTIRVEANDRSGNPANISSTNVTISKIMGYNPILLKTENDKIAFSAQSESDEANGLIILEEINNDHKFYNISGIYEGNSMAVKVSITGENDLVDEKISFEFENDNSGVFKFTGEEWIEIPAKRKGNSLTANINGSGIYQLRTTNGEMVEIVPVKFALHQNYPNPFNPVTTIKYDVAKQTHIKIMVFNVLGQKVITLVNKVQEPAGYQIQWNGLNDSGKKVASGLYFLTFKAGDVVKTNKMILLK